MIYVEALKNNLYHCTVCTAQMTVNNEIFVFCFHGHFIIVFDLAHICAKKKTLGAKIGTKIPNRLHLY